MMKNKKQMFTIISVFAVVLLVSGVTYTWFHYSKTTEDQQMIAGEIYLRLNEGTGEISRENIFPETPTEARSRNDNYITFNVSGLNTSNKSIYYEFILDYGEEKASPKTRYNDSDLRFDLVALDANGDEDEYLLSNVGYNTLVNKRIYVDTVNANTATELIRRYKLRMWLADTVIISDTDPNRSYTTTDYQNRYATIKLIVAGDFSEKSAPKQAYNLIKSLASTASYIASYKDITDQQAYSTYTTHDQVSDSAPKQTVYYYTGNDAAANANVVFAGYCWQIVRTTDNGGVRMIYNGIAQKPVTASTPITNTDITYTNDGTYAYIYDSTTKKWTSANTNQASTTDTFIFSVNTAGDYAINYKVSSQANGDYAKIYIKPTNGSFVLQTKYSGEVEGTFDLGTLATTDEVKIEYVKNASTDTGDDNIIFDIASVNTRGDTPVCAPDRRITGIKGINAIGNGTTQSMSAVSLYGRSYDYNLATGEFTIENSTGLPTAWTTSDANSNGIEDYKELIGTYTCLSNSDTCTTLYYVGSINQSNTAQAYVSKYTIGDVAHYSQMGTSALNPNYYNPAMVGYMFNEEYKYTNASPTGTYHTNAVWNPTSLLYELSSDESSSTTPNADHRYMCDDNDCTKVRYYYYQGYYIVLENGETVEDAVYKMTGNGTVETKTKPINANYKLNEYNSAIKGYLDNWYKKNLTAYASYLDGTSVYCNDRSISSLGGWDPTSADFSGSSAYLKFKQYSANRDLNCVNETDRFAVTNSKAELTYPIGLLTEPERNLMTDNFAKTGQSYWGASPYRFVYNYATVCIVDTAGGTDRNYVGNSFGARGVVTLKPGTLLDNGTGTYTDPYIVGPIVERNE